MKKLILSAAICVGLAFADPNKLSKELQETKSGENVDVIIQFPVPMSNENHNAVGNKGGQLKKAFSAVNGALYSVPTGALKQLAADPLVRYITPDRAVKGSLDYAEPTVNASTALQYGYDGSGVGVAIIDSGVHSHPDLSHEAHKTSRIVYSQSFVRGDSGTGDAYGHGTHVAGIVAGNGTNSNGQAYKHTFRGIAPNANIINLRVLDANGTGTDSAVINAIEAAIALKNRYNIRVINLSLGRPVRESYQLDPLCQAVEQAWNAGIVVVVAAGNNGRDNSMGTNGYATITAPGNDPYAITVGAMKDMKTIGRGDDLIASYSSKGPTLLDHIVKPDLVAPGNAIISALAPNSSIASKYPQNVVTNSYYMKTGNSNPSDRYLSLSGTSMAAPMVSGAAALLLQKNPDLHPETIKARLMKTATKQFPMTSTACDPSAGSCYTTNYDLFTIGAGYLDVWGALNNLDTLAEEASAGSPAAVFNASTNTVTLVNGKTVGGARRSCGAPTWFGVPT